MPNDYVSMAGTSAAVASATSGRDALDRMGIAPEPSFQNDYVPSRATHENACSPVGSIIGTS
jgi:hypothetical protein